MNIYLSTETNFNNNGLGFLTDTISAVVYDELNGNYSLKIEYMVNGHLSEYLERENIIKCPVADGTKQLFRIVNVIKTYEKIEITALHIFYDLLNNFLADVYPQNKNGQNFLQHLLDNTNFETNFTAVSDITDLRTARYVRRNPVEAIMGDIDNSMVRIFGGELKRNNFTINFLSRVGEDKGVKLLYGKNITGINISIDITEMATRVVPQGYNGLLLPELYVDSPLINNYPTPKILKMEFDDVVYDPNMEEAYHNIEDAYQALRDKVNEQYSLGLDKPRINIDVDWVELSKTNEYKQYSYLETVRLGDTIYADILGIIYTARVISTEYDVLLDRTTKFQIGTFVPTIATEITKLEKSVEQINPTSILQAAQDNATQLITTAMGGYVYKTNNELYIMDTDNPATAQKVWRWNINGLGYSSTGINGTYGIAMTMDGSIVADFITTGTLNANVIQGYGSLTTQVQDNTNAIGDRSGRTSTITQDIASIEAQIGDIADITTSAESEEAMIPDTQFQNIAESYPIRIEVHPIEDNISLLYPKKSGEIPQGNTTQNGTPTPDNPVSVENVTGDYQEVIGDKTYHVNLGKNLLLVSSSNVYINNVNNPDITTTYDESKNRVDFQVNSLPNPYSQAGYYYVFKTIIGKTYKIKSTWGNTSSTPIANVRICSDKTGTTVVNNMTSNTEYSFTATQEIYYFRVWITTTIGTGYVEYAIVSASHTTFSPYKTPIELCKIGDYQDFIKKSTGKNLFDKDNANVLDNMYTDGSTNTIKTSNGMKCIYIQCKANTTYTISKIQSARFNVAYTTELPASGVSIRGRIANNSATSLTITTDGTTNYLVAFIYHTSDTLTFQQIINSLMIEEGNIQTPVYEPYGKVWYIKKNIGKKVFNGTENWGMEYGTSLFNNNDTFSFIAGQSYSNYYKYNNIQSGLSGMQNGEYALQTVSSRIFMKNTNFTNANDFKSWLSTHNTSVYYVLANPTYEVITDDELVSQLEAIYKLSLYPSNDLYPKIRKIKFINTSTNEEFEYTLPMDLLYYDSTNYDTFVADYETELITITKNIGYDSSGKEIILQTPQIYTYNFDTLGINLTQGNYQVEIPTYSKGYLFVRLMVLNAYTAQYATKVELRSAITQTSQSIMTEVSQEYTTKEYASSLSTRINQTVRSISLSATDNGTSSSITIKLKNEDGTELSSEDANITLSGLVKFTDLSGEGSTIINGSNISTGTINASNVTITNLNANSITAGTLNVARIPNLNANKITAGQLSGVSIKIGNYFKVNSEGIAEMTTSAGFLTMGTTTHPYVSALNVAKGAGGISFRSGTTQGNAGSAIASIYLLDSNYLRINPGSRFYIDSHYGLTGQVSCIGQSSSGTYEYYMAFWKGILVGVSRSPFSTSTYPWLT